jgi:small-conductance mechanosensitive channel
VTLANLTGNAAFGSAYFGVLLYALVTILDALIAMLLRVRPFSSLGMVRSHRELLRVRIRWVLSFLAFIWWAYTLLDRLSIREQLFSGVGRLVTNEFSVGSISISLVDVAAFVVVVWASFWVSRFVRFLLEEDVYPRAHLSRGVPYAISKTLHYIILLAGFFVAVAALGVDMTKFTILASAFTVGVGFGLQNIFNNFVSGLILLFERPVQVGDVVQMNDASGIVERIGIRASVVRTTSGSEIIVPNGKLISETVVKLDFLEQPARSPDSSCGCAWRQSRARPADPRASRRCPCTRMQNAGPAVAAASSRTGLARLRIARLDGCD